MKLDPKLSILPGFLFVFDIDYPHERAVEELICLADVNDTSDLIKVFDAVLKPEFIMCSESDRRWIIDTISYYLERGETFVKVLEKRSFLFSDEIVDGRGFMRVLLECLSLYEDEIGKFQYL
jgi:hypothetical protein